MRYLKALAIAVPVSAGLLLAQAAQADGRRHGGGRQYRGGNGDGAIAALVLGLGAAAIIGGIVASQQSAPVYAPYGYQPSPRYYAPQGYAAPGYYAPQGYAAPVQVAPHGYYAWHHHHRPMERGYAPD